MFSNICDQLVWYQIYLGVDKNNLFWKFQILVSIYDFYLGKLKKL